jgi:hypothetical protein
MSSKFAFLLSMLFVTLFIALGMDMLSIQYAYSALDSKSASISYLISQYGTIDYDLSQKIETDFNVTFECLENCSPMFGEIVKYRISKHVNTILVSNNSLTISVERNAVIGFYG